MTGVAAVGAALSGNVQTLALMLVAFIAGAMCPAYFAQERFRGFGRLVLAKLPYRPPPGMDEETAMEEASDE